MDGSLMGVLDVRVLMCAECGDERTFEQPPCADGHDDCAEWACVDCGFAIFLDPVVVAAVAPRPVTSLPGSRDTRRHAA